MKRLLLLLVPVVLFAGQARYARLGEFDGKVDVQLRPGDPWSAAERNLPLCESAWLRTGAASRLEVELDEGSAWRLGPETQVEISDYTRLSTGQRFTLLSIDHGVAYFTGEPAAGDTLSLVAPGAQVNLTRGARVRVEAGSAETRVAVLEGVVRLSSPSAEIDIREGQTVRLTPGNPAGFSLDREVTALELDRWNLDRDKLLASPVSATHVAQHFGVADLDTAGEWVETSFGAAWKPKVADGWAPFQQGRWRWYDALGYTWVSDETWGWVPYHFGRWTRSGDLGWVWVPTASGVFKPGDVYWLYSTKLAAWGALAPGEEWQPPAAPQQFLNVNTTYANFHMGARVIDPAGFQDRPKEPLAVALFAVALPSPPFPASRLEALRPQLRVGSTRVQAVVPGTTFPETTEVPPPEPPPSNMPDPISDTPPDAAPAPPPDTMPSGPPGPVIYGVPAYTGIVIMNPPEHPVSARRNPNTQGNSGGTGPAGSSNTTAPAQATQPTRTTTPHVDVALPRSAPPSGERPSPVPIRADREAPRPSRPEPSPSAAPAPRPEVRVERPPERAPEARSAPRPEVRVERPAETRSESRPAPAPKVEPKPESKTDSTPARKQ